MSVNLVDLVLKQVGGNIPGIVGSLLGESADRTQGAIAGAVPAILGGLMGAASKGGDITDQIASAVDQQDDGILDDLAGAFGGNHQQIAEQGSSMLSSLLGDGVVGALVGAIGKFSGLGGGSTKSLLGMIAPIVISVLSREQKSQGLDGGGLMNLLGSQKDNIESAIPSGLASALGGADFLGGLMGTAQSATESIGEAAGQAATAVGDAVDNAGDAAKQAASSAGEAVGKGAEAASQAAQKVASSASEAASNAGAAAAGAAQSGGSWTRWLLPLIILLALLWLAFNYLAGSDVEETAGNAGDAVSAAVEATTEAAGDAADAASEAAGSAADAVTAMVGDIDVGGELTSMFDGLTGTLSGITDTASAEAAIPALEEVSSSLDNLTGLADQLPEAAVGGISELVKSGLSGLDGLIADLESIPGVGDLIKPVIDQIKEKLAAFTAA